ncbi:BgTH12-05898 [Blumeria graminis f. sp. triticale]|uniref:Bgt-5320 n=3 Tax=Blumeria graminis TaxID=34373 RepID=A0A381LFY5_BLUGR|nr:hypothetical protein BGT96224_5320 [Blumeria graminis f. sp. tritici 96224]CAD6504163.1 BgTH12-05898 [Blumeria graminis f. sp. triticale]VDB90932.1 Bgt-5320 [Blumeria graminis f. sp. tritici]
MKMATRTGRISPAASQAAVQPAQEKLFQKPKGRTGFSLRSSHGRKRTNSTSKTIPIETREKGTSRFHSKADPSMAMVEDQPSAVASGVMTTLAPIRAIQHRDKNGNPIAEPDRSNPTRSRWERPLDTIRSFEAAVDSSYSRQSLIRALRPTALTDERTRYRSASYYGPSPSPSMYHSSHDASAPGHNPHIGRIHQHPRFEMNGGNSVYPAHNIQTSYETVNSASGSASLTDPNYSTDPSSENSSIDQINYSSQKDAAGSYSFNSRSDNISPPYQSTSMLQIQSIPRQGHGISRVMDDIKAKETPRVPIKLGSSRNQDIPVLSVTSQPVTEKRKSWFGKRFSRSERT